MIPRENLEKAIRNALKRSPIVALLGPRQAGKTTLAHIIAKNKNSEYFDLEDPTDLARLEAPKLALENLSGLIVIDEIQLNPELFQILRVLVDNPRSKNKYLLLGSASPHIVKGISESLAGRVAFVEMGGFDLTEIEVNNFSSLWLRGGFPRSFLASSDNTSLLWRNDFIKTFLERDIPHLGITIPSATLGRFWTMVAHYHGNIWNAAEFARSLGSSEPTARKYLDILSGSYVVRQLPPWFENIGKRQLKAPKIYIRDSGLLHALLSLVTRHDLMRHPKLGASWEGFALEQVLSLANAREAYFWGTHTGAELDLLLFKNGRRIGFEFKCEDAPRITKSMHIATADLKLDRLFVIYPGSSSYRLDKKSEVVSILDIPNRISSI